MTLKTIFGFLIVLLGCSGIQQASKDGRLTTSGLGINNGINRGVGYTDSQGNSYNLRYIPITITNDSTISMEIRITFLNEYDYPTAYGDEQFRVFTFPKEMSPDDVTFDTISYELSQNELREFLDKGLDTNYIFNVTLEPDENYVMAIGTLYPRAAKVCGVLPNALFVQSNRDLYQECGTLMNQDKSAYPKVRDSIGLGLKLGFCVNSISPGCTLIPCGKISYPTD